MVWVRIDDEACDHPKLVEAGPEAAWLWLRGLAYCNRYTTNGLIKHSVLCTVGSPWRDAQRRRLAKELVRVNLWESHPGGYMVHDYHVQQLRAMTDDARDEAVTRARLTDAERAKRYRDKQKQTSRDDVTNERDDSRDESDDVTSRASRGHAPARGCARVPGPDPEKEEERTPVTDSEPDMVGFIRAAGRCYSAEYERWYASEHDGQKPEVSWVGVGAPQNHGHFVTLYRECSQFAKQYPGLHVDEVGRCVLLAHFARPRKSKQRPQPRFVVSDFADLVLESEELSAIIAKLRGAA